MKKITEDDLMAILDKELKTKMSRYGPVTSYVSKKRAVDAIMKLIREEKDG